MSSVNYSFDYQISTGTLGLAEEKILLSNGTETETWSVTIGASDPSDFWQGNEGGTMDFNDAAGLSGQGQLTIDPRGGTYTRVWGGTGASDTTGLSVGSQAAFEQNITDAITLFTADSSADPYAQYDLVNVGLSQLLPPETPVETYTLELVLTAS